jgi:hypothetical protein
MKEVLMNHIVDLVFTIVSVILVPMLSAWLKSKTQNERLKSMIEDIEVNVQSCVDYAEQTVVPELKKSGKWDSVSQKTVLTDTVHRICESILDSTKKTLESNKVDIVSYVTSHVEAYIINKKNTSI